MRGHRVTLPAAVAVAVLAAGAATLLLRPRGGAIDPVAVDAAAYFSPLEISRAEAYRAPQRVIGLVSLGVSGAALALLALRPPARLRAALERAGGRPLLGALAAGAAGSMALELLGLPLSALAHSRSVAYGLSTQEYGPWLGDVAKGAAVGAVMVAGLSAAGLGLARRYPRRWWMPASAGVVAVSAAFVVLAPVLLDPIFNRFEPLPPGPLRAQVLELAERSGVEVGEVYRVDASRRTTGANAYVGGLGPTKRVVLYDNLIDGFSRPELLSVVAHELGHQRRYDLWRGLAWLALVAPAGTLVAQRLAERLAPEPSRRPRYGLASRHRPTALGTPAALPAMALAVALVSFGLGLASNVLSRSVEARADEFALELTRDPRAFVGLERGITTRNLGDPTPPRALHLLFGTHPTPLERIGYGLAWERAER